MFIVANCCKDFARKTLNIGIAIFLVVICGGFCCNWWLIIVAN
jgi:hypothetical protein